MELYNLEIIIKKREDISVHEKHVYASKTTSHAQNSYEQHRSLQRKVMVQGDTGLLIHFINKSSYGCLKRLSEPAIQHSPARGAIPLIPLSEFFLQP